MFIEPLITQLIAEEINYSLQRPMLNKKQLHQDKKSSKFDNAVVDTLKTLIIASSCNLAISYLNVV